VPRGKFSWVPLGRASARGFAFASCKVWRRRSKSTFSKSTLGDGQRSPQHLRSPVDRPGEPPISQSPGTPCSLEAVPPLKLVSKKRRILFSEPMQATNPTPKVPHQRPKTKAQKQKAQKTTGQPILAPDPGRALGISTAPRSRLRVCHRLRECHQRRADLRRAHLPMPESLRGTHYPWEPRLEDVVYVASISHSHRYVKSTSENPVPPCGATDRPNY
jgi:hypothetical protein